MMQPILQFIVNQYGPKRPLFDHPLWFSLLGRLRRILRGRYDGWVDYTIGDISLRMPFSHELYVYKRSLPGYGENLGRLAKLLASECANFSMVDIGANIGDTVALVRKYARFPILCVEADAIFFSQMRLNLSCVGDIEFDNSLVAGRGGNVEGYMESRGGTAHFVGGLGRGNMLSSTLAEILERHPNFKSAQLIKVDTDGFDSEIILGALDALAALRPVIYAEYDPDSLARQGFDGLALFRGLQSIGYGKMLVYENFGDFMVSLDLQMSDPIEDIHAYFSGRHGRKYADIAFFPSEKSDWAARVRREEHHLARNRADSWS